MAASLRNTGIGFVGDVPWGTHVSHFFATKVDLLDALLPFLKAGLEAHECCLWLVADPLSAEEARTSLAQVVPDLGRHLAEASIEIVAAADWYTKSGALEARSLIALWEEKLDTSVRRGFAGLRTTATEAWLKDAAWTGFLDYEEKLNQWMAGKRMLALCSYPLATTGAGRVLEVARVHSFALAKRGGTWHVVETPEYREAKTEIQRLNEDLLRRVLERSSQLEAANAELLRRNRQQAAVAAIGQTAIRTQDLPVLMNEAAATSAATLGTELSAVLEFVDDQAREVRICAGTGWHPGVVGSAVHAQAALLDLRAEEALVVRDLKQDARFDPPPLLLQHGVVSELGVNIRGRTRWGALVVCSTSARTFTADEIDVLRSVAYVLALAVERHDLEVAQRREKEIFQAVFDNSPVMVSFYDQAGHLLRANREWERTVGWKLEEAQRTDVLAEAYPDPERLKEVREFMQRGEGRWAEFQARTSDGSLIDTQWMRISLSDGSQIGFGLDITERKRAEAERARLLESERKARAEAEQAVERLNAIQSITEPALAHLTLEALLSELLARLRRVLGGDLAHLDLIDDEHRLLRIRAVDGVPLNLGASTRLPLGEGIAGRIAAEGVPRIVEDGSAVDVSKLEGLPAELGALLRGSILGAPLLVEGRVIGVLSLISARPCAYKAEDLQLLQVVADRVAPAIERARLSERVEADREQLQTLSRRLLTAQEEERRRLAIELHDELGQVLTAVKIHLASLERESKTARPSAHLSDALASVDRAMERVRDLALDLRPSVLDDLGLAAALRWYADRLARTARVQTHLSIDGVPRLAPALETACFRVAQEALTNVARHAQAHNVWVDLHVRGNRLELRIRDDGMGFDADAARERAIRGGSMGLLGMQERVSLSGGELELESRPGGTEVRVRFPLDADPGAAP